MKLVNHVHHIQSIALRAYGAEPRSCRPLGHLLSRHRSCILRLSWPAFEVLGSAAGTLPRISPWYPRILIGARRIKDADRRVGALDDSYWAVQPTRSAPPFSGVFRVWIVVLLLLLLSERGYVMCSRSKEQPRGIWWPEPRRSVPCFGVYPSHADLRVGGAVELCSSIGVTRPSLLGSTRLYGIGVSGTRPASV